MNVIFEYSNEVLVVKRAYVLCIIYIFITFKNLINHKNESTMKIILPTSSYKDTAYYSVVINKKIEIFIIHEFNKIPFLKQCE